MKYSIPLFALFVCLLFLPAFAQREGDIEVQMGEPISNNNITLQVKSVGEVTQFEDFNLEESSVVNPYTFNSFKAAMAKGEIKVIFVDIAVKNISSTPLQLGHRPKLAGKGQFYLESDAGFNPQDSGNRSEYFKTFTVPGVVVSARKLMETLNGLYPENKIAAPGEEVSGKLLFIIPTEFAPAGFCNLVNSNICIGPFWLKLK